MTPKSTLTTTEFNLLSTAIRGLLKQTDFAKTLEETAALYAVFGTVIMMKHLDVNCRPVAGEFYLNHPTEQRVLGIGRAEGECAGTEQATFHTWIQTESHIIDLMSPNYPEIYTATNGSTQLPRRMLQLPYSDDAKNWEEFQQGVPLMTFPDGELTDALMLQVARDSRCDDLAHALEFWWQKLSEDPFATFVLYPDGGEGLLIARDGCEADGVWKGQSRGN